MEAKGYIEKTFKGMKVKIYSSDSPNDVMAKADSHPQIEGVNPTVDLMGWQTYNLTSSAVGFITFETKDDLMNFRSHHHSALGAESEVDIYAEALVSLTGSGLVILRHGAEDSQPELSNLDFFDFYLNVLSLHWED